MAQFQGHLFDLHQGYLILAPGCVLMLRRLTQRHKSIQRTEFSHSALCPTVCKCPENRQIAYGKVKLNLSENKIYRYTIPFLAFSLI